LKTQLLSVSNCFDCYYYCYCRIRGDLCKLAPSQRSRPACTGKLFPSDINRDALLQCVQPGHDQKPQAIRRRNGHAIGPERTMVRRPQHNKKLRRQETKNMTAVHRAARQLQEEDLPFGCTTLGSPFRSTSAGSLRDDIGVVTAHEVALSNLGLLLLQHCVQVLVPCTSHNTLSAIQALRYLTHSLTHGVQVLVPCNTPTQTLSHLSLLMLMQEAGGCQS